MQSYQALNFELLFAHHDQFQAQESFDIRWVVCIYFVT